MLLDIIEEMPMDILNASNALAFLYAQAVFAEVVALSKHRRNSLHASFFPIAMGVKPCG